jgi:DNA replication and repair protein RecF
MHLAHLRLRDFRNYGRLDVEFFPGFHLLLGNNAQGKTNLLEAVYLIATLRSFRGVGSAQMVRHGQKGYFVGADIVGQGNRQVKIYWSATQRNLTLDGSPVRRLSEYLGVLRTVVFCSEDLALVKGPARSRRRFMDLLISQTQPGYVAWLQRYTKALKARNALLKQHSPDLAALDSFSRELVVAGESIVRARAELIPAFQPFASSAYKRVSQGAEEFQMDYQPSVIGDFTLELAKSLGRDRAVRATTLGPHRDELRMQLNGHSAAQFASEGQKRTLAISLKMAQAEFLTAAHGVLPVLLIDDIMGELDLKRRSGFLPLLTRAQQTRAQVFMTATEENWPEELGRDVQRWKVSQGALQRA